MSGIAGNDIHRTNVPNQRCAYRDESLRAERRLLHAGKMASLDALKLSVSSPAEPPSPPGPLSPRQEQPTSPRQESPRQPSTHGPSKYERYDGPHSMAYAAREMALSRGQSSGLPAQGTSTLRVGVGADEARMADGMGGNGMGITRMDESPEVVSEASVLSRLDAQHATLVATQERAARLSETAARAEWEGHVLMLGVLVVSMAALLWRHGHGRRS